MSEVIEKEIEFISVNGLKHDFQYPVTRDVQDVYERSKYMAIALNQLFPDPVQFNLICIGNSGHVVASFLSIHLKQIFTQRSSIVSLRKRHENSHCGSVSMDDVLSNVNVMVDDFISSGSTMNDMYWKLKDKHSREIDIHAICITGCWEREKEREKLKGRLEFTPNYLISG